MNSSITSWKNHTGAVRKKFVKIVGESEGNLIEGKSNDKSKVNQNGQETILHSAIEII